MLMLFPVIHSRVPTMCAQTHPTPISISHSFGQSPFSGHGESVMTRREHIFRSILSRTIVKISDIDLPCHIPARSSDVRQPVPRKLFPKYAFCPLVSAAINSLIRTMCVRVASVLSISKNAFSDDFITEFIAYLFTTLSLSKDTYSSTFDWPARLKVIRIYTSNPPLTLHPFSIFRFPLHIKILINHSCPLTHKSHGACWCTTQAFGSAQWSRSSKRWGGSTSTL